MNSGNNGPPRRPRRHGMFSPQDRFLLNGIRRQAGLGPDIGRAVSASIIEGRDVISMAMHVDIDQLARALHANGKPRLENTYPVQLESYQDTKVRVERYLVSFIRELRDALFALNNRGSPSSTLANVSLFLTHGSMPRLKEMLEQAGYRQSPLYDNMILLASNMRFALQAHPNNGMGFG